MSLNELFRRGAASALMLAASLTVQAQTLRVNYIPILDVTPVFVAIDKGFFKEQGIDIVATPSTGGAAGVPGLMAGAYDVMYGNVVSTLMAQQQGFKLKIVSAGTKQYEGVAPTNGLIARKGDNVKTGKDLEGKTVAVNTRNGVIWLFARSWIAKTGGDPAKVRFKEVPFPQMNDALRGKQVDAAFNVSPFFGAAVAGTEFELVALPYTEVQPGVEVGQYVTTEDYFNKNPALLAKYNTAFEKGVAWYNANLTNPDLRRIVSDFTKMQPELVAKISMVKLPQKIDLAAQLATAKLMKESGLLTSDIDVRAMIAPAALQ
jgi:NitT/TauT family transport system substrate-binding protein